METKVRRIMADILGLDAAQIGNHTSMDNTVSWDSLAHISLMTAIEEEFEISLDIDEIESMRSMEHIRTVLEIKVERR